MIIQLTLDSTQVSLSYHFLRVSSSLYYEHVIIVLLMLLGF